MSPYALLDRPAPPTVSPTTVPGLVRRPSAYPPSDASRALRLLIAHAHRPLRDADGPLPEELVVRGALAILLGYPRRLA